MTIAETIRTAGSKIRRAIEPRQENSTEIFRAITRLEDAQANRANKRRKIFREQRFTTTHGTPEWQALEDQLLAFKAQDQVDAEKIEDLSALYEERKREEAAQALTDQDKAHQLRMRSYDQDVVAEMLDAAAKLDAAQTAANTAWQHLVATFDNAAERFPAFADYDMNPEFLSRIVHANSARIGKVPDDLQAARAAHPDRRSVISYPGADAYHDFITANQPEAIRPLAEELAAALSYQRDKVAADRTARGVDPTQAELNELSAAAGRKIAQMHPELSGKPYRSPSLLEMTDPVQESGTVQRSDLAVDGVTRVGRVNPDALREEAEARMAGMALNPAALAALLAGEIPGATVDLGTQAPTPRPTMSAAPPLHDTVGEDGEWLDRQGNTMAAPVPDKTNPHGLPEPGKEPAWNQGIEFEAGGK